MRLTKPARPAFALLVVALLLPGCGGGDPGPKFSREESKLLEIGEMYLMYNLDHKQPPKGPADFQAYREGYNLGIQGLQQGDYVVIWGVKIGKRTPGDAVLAYEKDVPTKGGAVLMTDRSVKTMTADEFKAAPKAKS